MSECKFSVLSFDLCYMETEADTWKWKRRSEVLKKKGSGYMLEAYPYRYTYVRIFFLI